ncbi:MAG: hypothetical protein FWF51_00700 [Chitinivibrionia bacterium]|nr:hypothetical protein [Chitinivibrionia bacterium]
MKFFIKVCIFLFFGTIFALAQDLGELLPTPDFNASLGIGFDYDYLKSPLDVDFENAKGYYSVNIPVKFKPSYELTQTILNSAKINLSKDGEQFMPNMAARQFANTTIKVDVPMLGGVSTFSHMNVMSLKYENQTGIPSFEYELTNEDGSINENIGMLLRGSFNIPIDFSLGWEAMTFGYVYKINKLVTVGLNLHRHRFYFNANAHIDMDIYGKVSTKVEGMPGPSVPIDYSLKNSLNGEYSLERWTPTFAARFWNFDLVMRFMFKDEAKGSLSGKYVLPFFINASTFSFDKEKLSDQKYIIDSLNKFMESETQTVDLSANTKMKWELPHVLTFKYNIIPEHLSVSYSKFIGKTYIGLTDRNIGKKTGDEPPEFLQDGLDFRMGMSLDHLLLINGKLGWFYGNLGIISIDFDLDFLDDGKKVLSSQDQPFLIRYGKGVMLPVLSGGGVIGTKIQFMLELDLLPLPALKTGLVYNF